MFNLLKQSLKEAPIIKKGPYKYFVHPVTDGIPQLKPELLKEVIDEIKRIANFKVDKIVTIEAAGIAIASPLSVACGIPLCIIRKRQYNLPSEVSVEQITAYGKAKLFINGIKKGDRLLLVDDTLSTGGTLKAVVQALKTIGAEIVDIVVVIDRCKEKEKLEKEIGQKIKSLVKIKVNDKVKVL
jgi:adenine phosphoribosyltransferase